MLLRSTLAALALMALGAPSSSQACDDEKDCRVDTPQPSGVALAADESEVRAKDAAKLELKIPPIWAKLRSLAYARLPQHKEKKFEATWIAMPVHTGDKTVAGVGLEGSWW